MYRFRAPTAAAVAVLLLVGCQPGASSSSESGSEPPASVAPSEAAPSAGAPSPAQSPDLSAGSPGSVTGQLVWDDVTSSDNPYQESVEVEGGVWQRVRERTARSEMNDARLSGAVTVIDNADRFMAGLDPIGDVLWGTIAIENDQGTWTGTFTGTSDLSADGRGVTYIELVGAGAYEGLSAVLFEREERDGSLDWNGVIFSGDLPPDR